MTRLAAPHGAFKGDRGEADPIVRSAIARAGDQIGYIRAIVTLCATRLIMPIVASGDDSMEGPDPDRHADLAAVCLTDEAGDKALIGFTGIDALTAWDATARPVLCTVDDLAATVAAAGAVALVIDVAGPVPFTIEGDVLTQLAAGFRLVELDDGGFGWVGVDQAGD